jgi:hypothetical protein
VGVALTPTVIVVIDVVVIFVIVVGVVAVAGAAQNARNSCKALTLGHAGAVCRCRRCWCCCGGF